MTLTGNLVKSQPFINKYWTHPLYPKVLMALWNPNWTINSYLLSYYAMAIPITTLVNHI